MVKVVIVMFSLPALAGDHIDHSEAAKPQGLSAGEAPMSTNYSVDIPAGAELCVHGGPCRAAAQDTMVDLFARRLKLPTRAIGMTDVLSPSQVRTFSDCEVRWFYEHLLGLRDPPTAILALDKAVRTSLMANFRHKLDTKEDIHTEGVIGLFRRAWKKQLESAVFCDDEVPEAIGSTGEHLS